MRIFPIHLIVIGLAAAFPLAAVAAEDSSTTSAPEQIAVLQPQNKGQAAGSATVGDDGNTASGVDDAAKAVETEQPAFNCWAKWGEDGC